MLVDVDVDLVPVAVAVPVLLPDVALAQYVLNQLTIEAESAVSQLLDGQVVVVPPLDNPDKVV